MKKRCISYTKFMLIGLFGVLIFSSLGVKKASSANNAPFVINSGYVKNGIGYHSENQVPRNISYSKGYNNAYYTGTLSLTGVERQIIGHSGFSYPIYVYYGVYRGNLYKQY